MPLGFRNDIEVLVLAESMPRRLDDSIANAKGAQPIGNLANEGRDVDFSMVSFGRGAVSLGGRTSGLGKPVGCASWQLFFLCLALPGLLNGRAVKGGKGGRRG
mmetsp:Transcript_63417/g.112719  ORF Transcript_63417/g.112719 Transcript_63417/m.112719 type:complete len:103 (-) Transcript_63417:709-1017(-)